MYFFDGLLHVPWTKLSKIEKNIYFPVPCMGNWQGNNGINESNESQKKKWKLNKELHIFTTFIMFELFHSNVLKGL